MDLIRPVTITDAMLVSSSVAEPAVGVNPDPPAYAPGATYALDAEVYRATTHRRYRSRVANNTGNTPETSPTQWLDIGPTNRWAMFDASPESQTTIADSLVVELTPGAICDGLALLNVSAAEVRVQVTDAVDGVVYDKTVSMVSTAGVSSWYAWYFESPRRNTDMILLDLPPYLNATITVTLTDPGATVACGVLVVGKRGSIGATKWGASVGISDFSRKSTDEFGNTTIVQRGFAKRGRFQLWIDGVDTDYVHATLAALRSTPICYIGIQRNASTFIYGFYKDFDVLIQYLNYSIGSVEIEGLK